MTTGRLYRTPDTDLRIYAVEEDGDVRWSKLSGDSAEIRNMRKSTKQEFETMRFNEGYEEDVKTLFTIVGMTIILMK
jgi:hypothetical protein